MSTTLRLHRRMAVAALAITLAITAGCASTPKEASLLSEYVNTGIQRMQAENEKLIHALGDVERGVLDEKWDTALYPSVEAKYRTKYGLGKDAPLTKDQQINVASDALTAYNDLAKEIQAKEDQLIQLSRKNAENVILINDSVRQYLLSLEKYDAARSKIIELGKELTGIDPSVLKDKMNTALTPATK